MRELMRARKWEIYNEREEKREEGSQCEWERRISQFTTQVKTHPDSITWKVHIRHLIKTKFQLISLGNWIDLEFVISFNQIWIGLQLKKRYKFVAEIHIVSDNLIKTDSILIEKFKTLKKI